MPFVWVGHSSNYEINGCQWNRFWAQGWVKIAGPCWVLFLDLDWLDIHLSSYITVFFEKSEEVSIIYCL